MDALSTISQLIVSQHKEWTEIVTDFETRNQYTVFDESGEKLYLAAEDSGSTLTRMFLKAARPFKISILKPDGSTAIRIERPFRFFFHRIDVLDNQGNCIGSVEKKFSFLRRIYSVFNKAGKETYQLHGPILKPWTFEIRRQGVKYGKITKKWSGLLKETFSDADNFGVELPSNWDTEKKAVFLGAVFLIDFVHFEDKSND